MSKTFPDFKNEMEKINVPVEKLDQIIDNALKNSKPMRRKSAKKPFVAAAIASLVVIGGLSIPSIQAGLEGIFEVSQYRYSEQESSSFGYGFLETGVTREEVFNSLVKMEETYKMDIPFPTKVWDIESRSENDEFRAGLNEEGEFISYSFDQEIHEKSEEPRFAVSAIKASDAKVKFDAETLDGTAINKEIIINDTKAVLYGVDTLSYSVYLEKEGWKFIINMTEKNDKVRTGLTPEKEMQLIEVAESIQ